MTTIEERAPLAMLLTPTERDELAELLARVERMALDLSATLGAALEVVRADRADHVDLGDPLAMFRLPDGSVAYLSVPVGGLRAGDWFQRQHGDEGWHHVRPLIFTEDRVGVPFDETGLEWFGREQMVRVARTPEHVAFVQEQRAAGR